MLVAGAEVAEEVIHRPQRIGQVVARVEVLHRQPLARVGVEESEGTRAGGGSRGAGNRGEQWRRRDRTEKATSGQHGRDYPPLTPLIPGSILTGA